MPINVKKKYSPVPTIVDKKTKLQSREIIDLTSDDDPSIDISNTTTDSSTKKRPRTTNDDIIHKRHKGSSDQEANNWEHLCKNAIDERNGNQVCSIIKKLESLERYAQARMIKLEQVTGCGVRMIDSNQSQDYGKKNNYNMCSRTVNASFTVGPNATNFSLYFSNENTEGDEEIEVSDGHGLFNYTQDNSGYSVDENFDAPTDEEIKEFLTKAGLVDAQPNKRCYYEYDHDEVTDDEDDSEDGCSSDEDEEDKITRKKKYEERRKGRETYMKEKDNERRRWVYCDIIHDAIERITDKYGTEDNCNVSLGFGSECMYRHLGLEI